MHNQSLLFLSLLFILSSLSARAAGDSEQSEKSEQQHKADIYVIGSKEEEVRLTGSGHYIGNDRIHADGRADMMSIMAKEVPGTSSYGEDGYSIFPNISFRGASTSRNGKITMMEDGILTAPGGYVSPAAYYAPNAYRIYGIEVLKGSSQVLYGPMTTGGVINFLSTPYSNKATTRYKLFAGTDNETQMLISHADKHDKFSYMLELGHRKVDGFKKIDALPAAEGFDREQTGHTIVDPILKLAYDLGGSFDQRFELKLARSETHAYESYLGLSDDDFKKNPYRRYAASRFDNIRALNKRGHLRHLMSFNENTHLTSTIYYQKFERSWYKLNNVRLATDANWLAAVVDPNNAARLRVMTGEDAGRLRVRDNKRMYESRGAEQNLVSTIANHEIKFGWRFHRDTEWRKHKDDTMDQAAGGEITNISRGLLGSQQNLTSEASAWAFHLQDEMGFGKFSIIPGVRFETIKFSSTDHNATLGKLSNTITVLNPGVGMRYTISDATTLFGGIYKGSALPSATDVVRLVNPVTRAEASYNIELGVRSQIRPAFKVESTLFYTHLKDLLALESIATGTIATSTIGKAKSYGVELKTAYDLGTSLGASFSNPWYLTATWNKTEIGDDYKNSGYLSGKKGNTLPYTAKTRFTAGTGIGYKAFSFDINGTHVGKMWKDGSNNDAGLVKAQFLVDASIAYQIRNETKLNLMVNNLLDKEHMISRSPYGARAGRPRTILMGLQGTF